MEEKNLWIKCPECGAMMYKSDFEENLNVCISCDYHFRIGARRRIEILCDKDSFKEQFEDIISSDPLDFFDGKEKYRDKLRKTMEEKNLNEAVITGYCEIYGIKTEIAVMDFEFLGGSMGSVVGEKITRAVEYATKQKLPLVIVSASGGARMHEGILSLMQMAKTSSAIREYKEKGGFYISVLTDPTTGGVTASFAMLGDIIISEPKALIGFAGPRVIEQTIKEKLPEGFQRAEFVKEHGFVDIVSHRRDLKNILYKLISIFYNRG
ncbi:MAG: acetyl-CoA carboxylase, carboxyltransferase subunit beta [Brevinematales bacterium]|nr:acetyl-CoA carboxylase, carboxyltransferase subunit beta [Brevinematales bacterium]